MYLFCFIVHIDLSFQFVCCFCCSVAFLKGLGVCPKEQGRPALEGTCYTSSLLVKELSNTVGSTILGIFKSQGLLRGTHIRDGRDDGDDISDTAPSCENTVTTVTYRHAY